MLMKFSCRVVRYKQGSDAGYVGFMQNSLPGLVGMRFAGLDLARGFS